MTTVSPNKLSEKQNTATPLSLFREREVVAKRELRSLFALVVWGTNLSSTVGVKYSRTLLASPSLITRVG